MSARSSFLKKGSFSPNLSKPASADISCHFMKTRSFCRTVYNMNGLYLFFFNSRPYLDLVIVLNYIKSYIKTFLRQTNKKIHLSKTDNFDAYCYVYLLWHHLTSVIKRLQLKRGPIWCIYLFSCFKLPFEILSRYDLCDITAESFFLLSILKEIVEWEVNTRKFVLRLADTPQRSTCRYSSKI